MWASCTLLCFIGPQYSFPVLVMCDCKSHVNQYFKQLYLEMQICNCTTLIPNVNEIASDIPKSCPKKTFLSWGEIPNSCILWEDKKIVKTLCDLEEKNSIPFTKAPQQCTITGCKMFYGSAISYCALKDIKSKINSSLNEL